MQASSEESVVVRTTSSMARHRCLPPRSRPAVGTYLCEIWKCARDLEVFLKFGGFCFQILTTSGCRRRGAKRTMEGGEEDGGWRARSVSSGMRAGAGAELRADDQLWREEAK
jgi:hypothetical protein